MSRLRNLAALVLALAALPLLAEDDDRPDFGGVGCSYVGGLCGPSDFGVAGHNGDQFYELVASPRAWRWR